MGVFAEQVAQAASWVRLQRSVTVVGARHSGATLFARALVDQLEAEGFLVMAASGRPYGKGIPYFGLRSLLPTAELPRHPLQAVDALSAALADASNRAVVLDALDDIDPETLVAAQAAADRTGTPTVVTRLPFSVSATPAERAPWSHEPGITIELGPLSYDQATRLAVDLLGAPVGVEVISHALRESAGARDLFAAMLDSARENGNIELRGGAWQLVTKDLWNPSVASVVETMLAELDRDQLATLYTVSLLGAVSCTDAAQVADTAELESLESRGFVRAFGEGPDGGLLSVFPPVVSEFFRRRPPGALGARLTSPLSSLSGRPLASRSRASERRLVGSSDPPFGSARRADDDAVVACLLVDRIEDEAEAAWAAWAQRSDARSAVNLLTTALVAESDRLRPEDVVATACPQPGDAVEDAVAFAVLRALWAESRSEGAQSGGFSGLLATHPDAGPAVRAARILLQGRRTGFTVDEVDELLGLPTETATDVVVSLQAYVALATGRFGDALRLVTVLEHPRYALLETMAGLVRSLALAGLGELDAALESSRALFEQARANRNRPGLVLGAYAVMMATAKAGRWADAEAAITHVLMLGPPGPLLAPFYGALLRASALFRLRLEACDLSSATCSEATGRRYVESILPAMQNSSADAAPFGGQDAADGLLSDAAKLMERGYGFAALWIGQLAVCVAPSRDRLTAFAAITARLPHQSCAQFTGFLGRCLAEPGLAVETARSYSRDGEIFMAVVALRRLAESSWDVSHHFHEAADVLEGGTGQVTDVGREESPEDGARLSDREVEVALLASTLSNAAIAARLGLSIRTIENHIRRALKRTGLRNRHDLAAYARRSRQAPRELFLGSRPPLGRGGRTARES